MAKIIKETVTSQKDGANTVVTTEDKGKATSSQTVEYLVYFFFGVLEILLAFRLVFKLMGANISNALVGLIYGVTGIFILPFEGIFHRGFSQGLETASVLEPSTLVALIVYAIIGWGIVKLLRVLSGRLD